MPARLKPSTYKVVTLTLSVGFRTVVVGTPVWRLDRLGRGLKHLIDAIEDLHDREIGFRSLTEQIDTTTSAGRLQFHIFGALAEVRERSSGSAPARAWPPPEPAAGSAAARASSPPRSSPPPGLCERRSTRWPRSRPRSGSAARPSTATWRSASSPTITPRRSSDGTPRRAGSRSSCRVGPADGHLINLGGFRGSAHQLSVRAACLAARLMKVVASCEKLQASEVVR